MHELGLTQEIVAISCERAKRMGHGTKICRIVVEVGALTAVVPESLAACFEICAAETAAQGAELEIRPVPGVARCRACGRKVALDRPFGRCDCGSSDLHLISGEELRIKEMEVVPCA